MKYIRTKTFIVEYESWMKIENNTLFIAGAKHEIIKQADTIEELCDEFVNSLYPKVYDTLDELIDDINPNDLYKIRICGIYGAIWTDKGLIYVAKMGEKGYLKLL